MELAVRIELTLSTLPKWCFTTKLRQLVLGSPPYFAVLPIEARSDTQVRPRGDKF